MCCDPQVFNDMFTGQMQALEVDLSFASPSLRVVVRGTGPIGQFTATVMGVSVRGRVRVLPIADQRMLLWSFLRVRGPACSFFWCC